MAGLNDSFDFNGVADTMTFTFASPVKGVGGFLNYDPSGRCPVISVYDASNILIESAQLSFLTDGSDNSGAFYGFIESSNRIKYFTLTDSFIGIANLTTITNSDFAPVPEPSSLFLFGLGVAGLAGFTSNKQRLLRIWFLVRKPGSSMCYQQKSALNTGGEH